VSLLVVLIALHILGHSDGSYIGSGSWAMRLSTARIGATSTWAWYYRSGAQFRGTTPTEGSSASEGLALPSGVLGLGAALPSGGCQLSHMSHMSHMTAFPLGGALGHDSHSERYCTSSQFWAHKSCVRYSLAAHTYESIQERSVGLVTPPECTHNSEFVYFWDF
jgi:hypothetical protein